MRKPSFNPFTLIADNLRANLELQSISSCSEYACKYRVMGKPFPGAWTTFWHPWLKDMLDCQAERMIGQKAAQMGFTEVALNKVFYAIDIEKENVLYVLPITHPDSSDFSTSRFDPALELSPHLGRLFNDVKNVGHKRAGVCNLFVRGSRSRSQLKSIPAGRMIFDEVDEMVQENITLAFERMSGQKTKQAFLLSTPTRDGYGINAFFQNSTQEEFFFRCPHCGQQIRFEFPESLVITADTINDPRLFESYLRCPRPSCHGKIEHEQKPYLLKDVIRSYDAPQPLGDLTSDALVHHLRPLHERRFQCRMVDHRHQNSQPPAGSDCLTCPAACIQSARVFSFARADRQENV